jgi:hypothetical protein
LVALHCFKLFNGEISAAIGTKKHKLHLTCNIRYTSESEIRK